MYFKLCHNMYIVPVNTVLNMFASLYVSCVGRYFSCVVIISLLKILFLPCLGVYFSCVGVFQSSSEDSISPIPCCICFVCGSI